MTKEVKNIDTPPVDTSTPVQGGNQQPAGQDAAPTGVAEAFAALLAGIVATPVVPPAGTGTAPADVATTGSSTTAAPQPVLPAAPVISSGASTATAVLAGEGAPADSPAPVSATAPADPAGPTTVPVAAATTPVPAPIGTAPALTSDTTPSAEAVAATAEAVGSQKTPTTSATTTTPAATTATPGTSTKDAAIESATAIVDTPAGTASPATTPPVQIVPTTPAGTSAGTTSDSDSTNGKAGSETATQTTTPATAEVDAVQPAAVTTATDGPQLIVPVVTPTTATTPVATVSALPPSLTSDRERFVRLVDGLEARLRVSGSEGGKAMRMTLRPAELGDLTVRLHIAADGQSATATLLAQNHQTGDLLAQAAGDLRQALADRGLRLDRIEVTAGSLAGDPASDGAPSGASNPNRQDTRRTHYAFDARNEALADPMTGEGTAPTPVHEGLYVLA